MPDFSEVLVHDNSFLAEGVRYLELGKRTEFLPGQCVTLSRDGVERHYSIASRPGSERLAILYDVLEGGKLSPRLADLMPGDSITVSKPFGSFTDSGGEAVWIATGTGIAPFLSMARAELTRGKELLHGARTADRLYFREELLAMLGTGYRGCVSRPETGVGGEAALPPGAIPGRLTSLLEDGPLRTDIPYYLCGSSQMVVDVRDLLVRRGVPFDKIFSEIYF